MDLHVRKRFPNREPTASERFLGVPSHAALATTTASSSEELHEDDVIFFSADLYAEPNHNNHSSYTTSSSSSSSAAISSHHHGNKGSAFTPPNSFGILAALPGNVASTANHRNAPQLFHNHKASVSSTASSLSSSSSSSVASSTSSSVRVIPAIPRPPMQQHDRFHTSSSSPIFWLHHQSAPVNVPVMSEAAMKARRRRREFDEVDGEDEGEEEWLPPHEIVDNYSAQRSPVLACSVLEGVGRTLKGRDLRRVRNAVWRQTGFLD